MGIINIQNIDKVRILHSLLRDAKISRGWMCIVNKTFTLEEVEKMYNNNDTKFFKTISGKPLYINLNGHSLYSTQYDKENGENACYNSINHLLTKKNQSNEQKTKDFSDKCINSTR